MELAKEEVSLFEELRKTARFRGISSTCDIRNPLQNCVTYVGNEKILNDMKIEDYINRNIIILISEKLYKKVKDTKLKYEYFVCGDDVDPNLLMILFHNYIYADRKPGGLYSDDTSEIHKTVFVEDGITVVKSKTGFLIRAKHIGGVRVGKYCYIGPDVILHRGTIQDTIIEENCIIAAKSNIGHNSFIGSKTVLGPAVLIGGSTKIGECCYIGMGANIRNGVSVCDNVMIGMGSVVVHDVETPGVWRPQ